MDDDDDDAITVAGARTVLYEVLPADFVETRSMLAKQAQDAGDREAARQIKALRKPATAAWAVNMLARARRDLLGELIELGRDLREGMSGIDAAGLRELTRRRHQLVASLVREAREIAAARGLRVSDEAARAVQTTLEATLSDADSADAVVAGCLDEPIEVSGFGFGFPSSAAADTPRRSSPGSGRATVTDIGDHRARKEAETAEAEQALVDAQLLYDQAEDAYVEAEREAVALAKQLDKTSRRIDRLEAQLTELRAQLAEENQASKEATAAEAAAEKAVQAADRALLSAAERVRRLRK